MRSRGDVYWDTCVWLELLDGSSDRRAQVEALFISARAGGFRIYTSAVTLFETQRLSPENPGKGVLSDQAKSKIDALWEERCITVVEVTRQIALQARDIVRSGVIRGKPPDAIHIASALRVGVRELHTFDKTDLLGLDEHFSCQDGTPLTICEPLADVFRD